MPRDTLFTRFVVPMRIQEGLLGGPEHEVYELERLVADTGGAMKVRLDETRRPGARSCR